MRVTLSWKITTILVLFGLVPASIIAWFAYKANDDFKDKQTLIVKQTGEAISYHVARYHAAECHADRTGAKGKSSGPSRGRQIQILSRNAIEFHRRFGPGLCDRPR